MKELFQFVSTTGIFLIILACVIIISLVLIFYKKREPYVLYTAEDLSDNMQMQSVYLVKKIAKAAALNPSDRRKELDKITKELSHFRNMFADAPGVWHEYNDLKNYLDKQRWQLQA